MEAHSTLVFIHLLLFVFWLGTDIGVFLAAKMSERDALSVETRATLMQLGMVLDRLPRTAVVLIVPTGLQLAVNLRMLDVPSAVMLLVWAVSAVWVAVLWSGFLNPHSAKEQRALKFNFIMHVIMVLAVLAYLIFLLLADTTPFWLMIKIAMIGCIFVAGIVLDVMFKPAVAAFGEIVGEGATPERNERYSRAIAPVYTAVLLIYAFVVVAAYFGTSKLTF